MAYKFSKGYFEPKNKAKYSGKLPIIYRSSWELKMMEVLDSHPNIIAWQSESFQIPYRNPLTGKFTVYIPDFLVLYADATGKQHCDMIEIKPLKEVPGYQKVSEKTGRPARISPKDKASQIVNAAKWEAAILFCKKRGWNFRVATAEDLFRFKRNS